MPQDESVPRAGESGNGPATPASRAVYVAPFLRRLDISATAAGKTLTITELTTLLGTS